MKNLYLATAAIIATVPAVFSASDVEPVKVIKGPNGYPVRISASQYNPAQHELHVADDNHDEHGVARNKQPAFRLGEQVPTVAEYVAARYSAKTYAKRFANPISTPDEIAAAIAAEDANPIKPANAPATAPARQFGVLQNKGKFYIVDPAKEGEVVTDVSTFDPKGYPDNASAWAAITAAALAPPATDNSGAAV